MQKSITESLKEMETFLKGTFTPEAKERLDALLALAKQIARANEAYHGHDNPEITDGEYDALRRKFREKRRELILFLRHKGRSV